MPAKAPACAPQYVRNHIDRAGLFAGIAHSYTRVYP